MATNEDSDRPTAGTSVLRERLADEISGLSVEGAKLAMSLSKDGDEAQFRFDYLGWFNTASAVIQRLAPDLSAAFAELYQPRGTKLTLETWGVHHYLLGLAFPTMDSRTSALARVMQQISILKSLERRLDSIAVNLRGVLQAELFDNELEAARELLKLGHLRAAGAVAGVVVERHLSALAAVHEVKIAKRDPTIADLNDRLRDASVYPQTTWRRIQYIGDIRNLCVHKKDRDPTADEVRELIGATDWFAKSVA